MHLEQVGCCKTYNTFYLDAFFTVSNHWVNGFHVRFNSCFYPVLSGYTERIWFFFITDNKSVNIYTNAPLLTEFLWPNLLFTLWKLVRDICSQNLISEAIYWYLQAITRNFHIIVGRECSVFMSLSFYRFESSSQTFLKQILKFVSFKECKKLLNERKIPSLFWKYLRSCLLCRFTPHN